MKTANRIWEIAYPVLMYYAAISIGIFLAQLIFGSSNETYMLCKIIGSLVAIPIVYQDYKSESVFYGGFSQKAPFAKDTIFHIFSIIGIMACISIALNNVICMSPLVKFSSEFEDASNALYGSQNLFLEILGSALITPFLEEMLHRGVVYRRLRRRIGLWPAILLSTLVFAILHFNIVQFTYTFLLGIVLALFIEKTQNLYAPVLAHVTANLIAVIRTETGFLQSTVDGSILAWVISIAVGLIGLGALVYYNRQ